MPKYNNPISITSARKIVVQQPSDDRLVFDNVAQIINDALDNKPLSWYEFMPCYIRGTINSIATWQEVTNNPNPELIVLGTNYTYPSSAAVYYAGKQFAFYLTESVAKTHSHTVQDIADITIYYYNKTEIDAALQSITDPFPVNNLGQNVPGFLSIVNDTITWAENNYTPLNPNDGDVYARLGLGWIKVWDKYSTDPFGQEQYMMLNTSIYNFPAGQYNLPNPANLPTGTNFLFFHDNQSANDIELIDYPVDNFQIPFVIQQNKSAHIVVVAGVYRLKNKT
jgi:hypothetical protein